MKTNHEHIINRRKSERGNALVYVLIAIVLFAALSFTLSRQTDSGEASGLDGERATFYATQLIGYASQVRSVVDQMTLTGTDVGEIDFIRPAEATFNTPPHINKIYHPEGGGLTPATLSEGVISQVSTDPVAGWYLGRFSNVEWTDTTNEDAILVAYQIPRLVCEQINKSITGTTDIPVLGDSLKEVLIDEDLYSSGSNVEFTTDGASSICEDCDNVASLCVKDSSLEAYGFYTVVGEQ